MRYFRIILVVLLLALTLSACGGGSDKPASLQGKWASDSSNGTSMNAVVKNDVIKITIDDEDSSSLYWQGTFAKTATNGDTIVSKADTAALESSILGSQNKTKAFTYDDGTLTFDMSMMGTTKHVKLSKS